MTEEEVPYEIEGTILRLWLLLLFGEKKWGFTALVRITNTSQAFLTEQHLRACKINLAQSQNFFFFFLMLRIIYFRGY